MIKNLIYILITTLIISSCNLEGVKNKTVEPNFFEMISDSSFIDSTNYTKEIDKAKPLEKDSLENGALNNLVWNGENGLRIEWTIKKTTNIINKGDVILANYSARVARGEIYDSNSKLTKPVPLKTGIGQLIKGWEVGLLQMHAGDKGRIMIPSKLAYGEQGILGRVPQNADIIVDIEIVAIIEPIILEDGVKVYKYETVSEQVYARKNQNVTFHYFAYRKGKKARMYTNSYEKGEPFSFKYKNSGIVDGLHIGFSVISTNEKAFIEIPAKVAYGKKGLLDLVPANTDIVFDVRDVLIN